MGKRTAVALLAPIQALAAPVGVVAKDDAGAAVLVDGDGPVLEGSIVRGEGDGSVKREGWERRSREGGGHKGQGGDDGLNGDHFYGFEGVVGRLLGVVDGVVGWIALLLVTRRGKTGETSRSLMVYIEQTLRVDDECL